MSITGSRAISRAAFITHTTAIPRTMAIRLPTVDKYHVAASQLILLSFIDQFPFPILDHKTKVKLQFLTLAGVRFYRCQRTDLLEMEQRGSGER